MKALRPKLNAGFSSIRALRRRFAALLPLAPRTPRMPSAARSIHKKFFPVSRADMQSWRGLVHKAVVDFDDDRLVLAVGCEVRARLLTREFFDAFARRHKSGDFFDPYWIVA
jgi:hypothetical protein